MKNKIITTAIFLLLFLSIPVISLNHFAAATEQAASSTQISCYCNPLYLNANSTITLTATITGTNPTGTITWATNSTTGEFNSTTTQVTAGQSSVTYNDTQTGNVTITANYNGDTNNGASSSTISLTLYNLDFNHDGNVNFQDTVYFVKAYINYNQIHALTPATQACDLNNDGKIDFTDLQIYVHAYVAFAQSKYS